MEHPEIWGCLAVGEVEGSTVSPDIRNKMRCPGLGEHQVLFVISVIMWEGRAQHSPINCQCWWGGLGWWRVSCPPLVGWVLCWPC